MITENAVAKITKAGIKKIEIMGMKVKDIAAMEGITPSQAGKDVYKRQEEILAELDLIGFKDRHPRSLSGGQKQRVAIASAIASKRSILFFDEPTKIGRAHV